MNSSREPWKGSFTHLQNPDSVLHRSSVITDTPSPRSSDISRQTTPLPADSGVSRQSEMKRAHVTVAASASAAWRAVTLLRPRPGHRLLWLLAKPPTTPETPVYAPSRWVGYTVSHVCNKTI